MRDVGVSPDPRRDGSARGASDVRFSAIRDDWYKANQLVPRLARSALANPDSSLVFVGFPRQWIPVFEYYGLAWRDSSDPIEYMPIVSELSEAKILGHCLDAREHGVLRTLLEGISALDPVLADFVYILDRFLAPEIRAKRHGACAVGKAPDSSDRMAILWPTRDQTARTECRQDHCARRSCCRVAVFEATSVWQEPNSPSHLAPAS